ncbi:BSP-domain-containing protein [Daldinia loculata]|uniref:BSP-domain-containing protein n=1 Tax=Daldinia loculata TaxID=103429 RepID=UPI0020C2F694|nr:BSP-domain-containing protein [Daldinia loculata]KAI1651433.1 BSP-domain-containing protein [Daldinia loculata]
MSSFNAANNLSGTETLHIHLRVSQYKEETSPPLSMPPPPATTPVPQPVFMPGMSHAVESPAPAPAPAPSAIPTRPKGGETPDDKNQDTSSSATELPRLRLHVQDIAHPGSSIFLSSVNAATVLCSSIESIHKQLYSQSPSSPPPTRSVTLILRDMDGVAYTTGSDLDSDHKEIHFSLRYISSIAPSSRQSDEIHGVLLHELVHCYQWNGRGRAPGGLIEGVADWVRLQSDLAPPHWSREQIPAKWDVGYQGTAYFLEYLEDRFGKGTIRRMNEKLRKERYEEKAFWTELVGGPVEQLFEDYKKTLLKGE